MLRRVQQYIRTQELLTPRARVLVCVSGGADSMALLDVLQRGGYNCVVAHCNFHLRGAESDRDEAFVRQAAADRQIDCHVQSFDTQAYAAEHRLSIEVAAREQRYRWFEQLARETGCEAIAVAHHQNDQAETVVLNLLRGAGLRGLGGMRPKSANPVTGNEPPIIRPLLCTTHEYIVHYLRDIRHLSWVEDSTNTDTTIRRNSVRAWLNDRPKGEIENICATAAYMQGYADQQDNQPTRARELVELYEQLKAYQPKDIEAIYDAMQRGESGKRFELNGATAIIKKHTCSISE
ncbi:MAG: tRNA lysidine(34) synthetase TilS [Paludibacteraceae bacterium]|nr:tRNA lysidine(34) synthetase TilS [Paludibacteraceae bacterium]